MKEKKSSLHFAGRRHARGGVIATVIAGIAWCIFIALCVCSAVTGGNADFVVGIIGILDALFAMVGMVMALRGFQEREVYYVFPILGMVLCGILFAVYFSLYCMGIAIS